MKHEPTAATMAGIYHLMDMELEDLNAIDIREANQAFRLICEATDGIQIELNDAIDIMTYPGKVADTGRTSEGLHEQFTQIYRTAIEIAGKSVRLAAIARTGIIQSETISRIDRAETGGRNNGLERECNLCS